MKDFVSIYKYQVIKQETPWSVHKYLNYQCVDSWLFATKEEAETFASTLHLPIIHQ